MALAAGLLVTAIPCRSQSEQQIASETEGETMIVAPGAVLFLRPPSPELRLEAALNGGLVAPVIGKLTAPEEEGTHWLSVLSRDAAGNASELRWIRLVVDATPPELELEFSKQPTADIRSVEWLPAGTKITARAVDLRSGIGGVSIEAESSDGVVLEDAGPTEASIVLAEEGDYDLRAEAIDAVDNRTEPLSAHYRVDGVGPYGHLFTEGPHVQRDGLLVVGPGSEIHLKLDDARSGIVHWMAKMDGEQIEKKDYHSGWTPGRHEAGAMMMDLVGNHSELETVPFFFDDAGPGIDWSIASESAEGCEGRPVALPPVVVRLAAEDTPAGVSTFRTSTDGTTWIDAESELTTESAGLRLRATDAVGNVTEIDAVFDIDRTPPSLALIDAAGEEHAPGSFFEASDGDLLRIAVEDDSCSVPSIRYRYEDGRAVAAEGRAFRMTRRHCFIRPFFDRYCRITVEATDLFGRETEATWRVRVERPDGGGA